ncbi:hypothetical protein SFA35_13725 [Pseudomonas sp. HR96]|uniref:hypothetical protein n=1 Tax=Pseudomonas sp. HR96 TaxID=1027966 RepID=UPI002A754D5D|nr:hypothetical protein [Pseudomonas sp. HR96]WPO97721.1 hypothetical protein SFA35_13725 [Pseudomonas sp. HR96]
MKLQWVVAACALLVGCSSDSGGSLEGKPVQITAMAPSYDSSSDTVDLSISLTNISKQPLRAVQIEIRGFDSAGRPVNAGGPGGVAVVSLYGPYEAGAKVGPVTVPKLWTGSDVRCLEVTEINASGLDYSTSIIDGAAANNLVAGDARRVCRGAN